MRNEILRAEHIVKTIHGSLVLNGLSLMIMEQEILGMVVISGSGKSVIAEVLAGIRSYDSGVITVAGQRLESGNRQQAAAKGIYHIREKGALFSCLTIEENICLTEADKSLIECFPSRRQLRTVREAIRSLDINIDFNIPVKDLNLYQQHVVSILRAYYLDAKLIILDNITSGYTQEEFRQLGYLLLKLKRKGRSILFIDSRPERVVSFTDRLVILRGGRDEGILFKEEYEDYDISRIMLGDYKIPKSAEKLVLEKETEVLLSAHDICVDNIRDFSFVLRRGEVIGFVDEENGICRELLQLFQGNAVLLKGNIELEGLPLPIRGSRNEIVHRGIGYVENYKNSIFPKRSLCDNLTITSLDRLTSKTMIHSRLEKMVVRDLLNRLNIPVENMKKSIEDVSNPIQLVAALYKWILNRSQVVILNNVLSGTDVIMHNIVVEFLNELREKGCGAILFSPNTKEIYNLCDRIYVIPQTSPSPQESRDAPASGPWQ